MELREYEELGGDAAGARIGNAVWVDYNRARVPFDGGAAIWIWRTCFTAQRLGVDRAIAQHQPDWRSGLEAAVGRPIAWPEAPTPPRRKLAPPPSRDELLNGRMTAQGMRISTTQFGVMPWFGACWAWLSPDDRERAAQQLIAAGDTVCLIQVPDGIPLYDEPNQFYTADKFGPLDLMHGNSRVDPALVALIEEAIGFGFVGVWLFLGGDDGQRGFPIAIEQTRLLGPALARSALGNLNDYVVQIPGWDGVWHKPQGGPVGTGWSREQLQQFAQEARRAGARYVGVEHGTGYALAGHGAADFQEGGVMRGYDLILGEFNDNTWDGSVWQILARYLPPGTYRRPPEQPTTGPEADPGPHPYYLADSGAVYRVFEFYIYGSVRGTDPARVRASRARFEAMGATNVC